MMDERSHDLSLGYSPQVHTQELRRILDEMPSVVTSFNIYLRGPQNVNSKLTRLFIQGMIYFIHSHWGSIEYSVPCPMLHLPARPDTASLTCQPVSQPWKMRLSASQRKGGSRLFWQDASLIFTILPPRAGSAFMPFDCLVATSTVSPTLKIFFAIQPVLCQNSTWQQLGVQNLCLSMMLRSPESALFE